MIRPLPQLCHLYHALRRRQTHLRRQSPLKKAAPAKGAADVDALAWRADLLAGGGGRFARQQDACPTLLDKGA